MAIIQCEECGREISDRAPACPHCGNPRVPQTFDAKPVEVRVVSRKQNSGCGPIILALVIVAVLAYACSRDKARPRAIPGHSPNATLPEVPEATTPRAPNATVSWERVGGQGDMSFVVVPPPHDSDAMFKDAVAALCRRQAHCFVHFWADKADAPRRLPMTDAQVESEIAAYRQNTNTGLAAWRWRCGQLVPIKSQECY